MKKKETTKYYEREYIVNAQCINCWTVDEIAEHIKKNKKYKKLTGNESVQVYPKINDYGKLHWHLEIYRYNEVKK